MSRPTSKTTPPVDAVILSETAEKRIADTQDALALQENAASDNAKAMALQVGYEGSLAVGAIEDEIRFYQRRTVEAILETGKRLLVLRELLPKGNSQIGKNGEFEARLEFLGFSKSTAYRFMQAASKTAKSANLAVLTSQVKSASAFLELVTHDDDTLEVLTNMDDIDRMSATQLREALRQAKEDNKYEGEQKEKERIRAEKAEKALRAGGPKARSLEEQVSDFSSDVNKHQDTTMDGLLNIDQQVRALESWYLQYVAAQPGFEPGERFPMPVEVLALVQKLSSNVDRIASAVGGLQQLIWNSFGHELESSPVYQMEAPAEAVAA